MQGKRNATSDVKDFDSISKPATARRRGSTESRIRLRRTDLPGGQAAAAERAKHRPSQRLKQRGDLGLRGEFVAQQSQADEFSLGAFFVALLDVKARQAER